ncbi:hypothetical protein NC651_005455 [Populus alba x Populus x berolinensis]|nr:hypothetical protein NC651_005455 [Populus alba x Populus x berolinensis]
MCSFILRRRSRDRERERERERERSFSSDRSLSLMSDPLMVTGGLSLGHHLWRQKESLISIYRPP